MDTGDALAPPRHFPKRPSLVATEVQKMAVGIALTVYWDDAFACVRYLLETIVLTSRDLPVLKINEVYCVADPGMSG